MAAGFAAEARYFVQIRYVWPRLGPVTRTCAWLTKVCQGQTEAKQCDQCLSRPPQSRSGIKIAIFGLLNTKYCCLA